MRSIDRRRRISSYNSTSWPLGQEPKDKEAPIFDGSVGRRRCRWPVGNSLADALVVERRQAADFAPLPPDAGLVSDFASDLPSDAVESLPTSFLAPFPPPARA